MTITLTSKNQITLPKKIVDVLRLRKGTLFNVKVNRSHIELFPLETKESAFTEEDYRRLDQLVKKEKNSAKRVTPEFIKSLMNNTGK